MDVEIALTAQFSPEEPHPARRKIVRLDRKDYRGRTWATRERLRIDRVCSAWLIRRFIDRKAKFVWLKRPKDCPKRAVGFDFDGAEFTHVDSKVTFEVLLASFGLEGDVGLVRLGALVHYLDVGCIPVAEAPGLRRHCVGHASTPTQRRRSPARRETVLDSLYRDYSNPDG